ncbi:MAG: glucose 1-dehydrogenase [Actinomycetota bacterium]|jgi:NAD(P)-dependent dehydrogenase (short-subunit alcohol dehydrogenase family)
MAGLLEGKVAIITGAAKGIGKAIAEAYAGEGATVVVSDIDEGLAKETASRIPNATAIACDVRSEEQVKSLVDQTVAQYGGLHILVPNAGIGRPVPLLNMDYDEWRAVTSVNLDGVFLAIRYGAPAIIASGGGAIVNICSITAQAGTPLIAHYSAAKAGVMSLTQSAAVELRAQGVRVNAILPGFIETDLVTTAKPGFEQMLGFAEGQFDQVIAMKQGRYGTVEEVARMAVFLASDRSSFSNGSPFVLDGGCRASLL